MYKKKNPQLAATKMAHNKILDVTIQTLNSYANASISKALQNY